MGADLGSFGAWPIGFVWRWRFRGWTGQSRKRSVVSYRRAAARYQLQGGEAELELPRLIQEFNLPV